MQTGLFYYKPLTRRRHWSEAGGLLVCPNSQSLPLQFLMHDKVVQPKAHLRGLVSPGQPADRSLCEETAIPSQGPLPFFASSYQVTFSASSPHLSVMTSHPLPHLPLEYEHTFFQATKSFSLSLSSFCRTYMLHVLPSLQMFLTLQHNPFLLFPGETCYLYVK